MNQWYRRDNSTSLTKYRGVLLGIGVVLVIALSIVAMPQFMSGGAHTLSRPFVSLKASLSQTWLAAQVFVHAKGDLLEKNAELQMQVEEMRAGLLVTDALRRENSELRSILGRNETHTVVYGHVLYQPPQTLYDTLVIDVGSASNVSVGDLVVARNVVVGAIRKVTEQSSVVVLFSAPGEQTRFTIEHEATSTPVTAYGRGSGNFLVEVPRDLPIVQNDVATLSTLPGYSVAVVGSVHADASDSFQTVRLRVPINIMQITTVIVYASSDKAK